MLNIFKNTLKKQKFHYNFIKRTFIDNHKNNTNINNETDDKKEKDFISFGYKNVKKEDRQNMVNSVFANVAKK
jgi:hypothetical protein